MWLDLCFWWYGVRIGSILNPLAGEFSKDSQKKGKGVKQGHLMIGRDFICCNDWLKGTSSHMTNDSLASE